MQSTTFTFQNGSLPPGLCATAHTVSGNGSSLIDRKFSPENVYVSGGLLQLKVPGGQTGSGTVSCAEVATSFETLYGSMRVWAMLSDTEGVCNGMCLGPIGLCNR